MDSLEAKRVFMILRFNFYSKFVTLRVDNLADIKMLLSSVKNENYVTKPCNKREH